MKLSVCTDSVFGTLDTVQGMTAVKAMGIEAVEFWSWWDKDIEAIKEAQQRLGLTVAAICTKFISLTEPERRDSYLSGLAETIQVAKGLGCSLIISQVGNRTLAATELQTRSLVKGLRLAKSLLEEANMTLVIEPLNTKIDHPGYFLASSEEGAALIREVASPHIKLLFDCYHQQIMEGDLMRQSTRLIEQIGHFHLAGNPGRGELETGEINYQEVIRGIAKTGYEGYLGLEYFPTKEPEASLADWQSFLARL